MADNWKIYNIMRFTYYISGISYAIFLFSLAFSADYATAREINAVPVPISYTEGEIAVIPHSFRSDAQKPEKKLTFAARLLSNNVAAKQGSLREGLDAISNKNIDKARSLRLGMRPGSLNRKILAWSIALSGKKGVPSHEIAKIARDLASWPGQRAMRRNYEIALARENPSAGDVIRAFGKQQPKSISGAVLLAKSYLNSGNKKAAHKIIAPFWHRTRLSKETETNVLRKLGSVLSIKDHRIRMHRMFYRNQTTAANRMASLARQTSLAKARNAVAKRHKDAGKKLEKAAISWGKDPGYIFSKIRFLRRAKKFRQAALLMESASRDPVKLIDPDKWWVERRVLSRNLLNIGEFRTAYKLAAGHSVSSRVKQAEAEFHAGWYALRFLKNRILARKHFLKILEISNTPISQARGYYWLARSYSGIQAKKYYKKAAHHQATYYGQLAAVKLGKHSLLERSPKPDRAERLRFKSRELVKVINNLEANRYGWRADIIYRHLAKTLPTAGEIALLSARAEKQGKLKLALQTGKIAYRRGLLAITSSWPLGAIPKSAKIKNGNYPLTYSIARQESAFDHKAISRANARGLLQLLPGTAKLMAKQMGVAYSYKKLTREPAYNAMLGSAYLSRQLSDFNGSYILAFAAYNAGPQRVKEWIAQYGDPRGKPLDQVIDWVERIPFTETRNYVQRVTENMQVYKARINGSRLEIDRDIVQGRR